jgi:lipopolysaccharide transport system ATP-binding protein
VTQIPEAHKRELLRLENVGVSYLQRSKMFKRSEYWALKDVSFSVYHGETLGIIGRNGVGKSTLLRLLARIISPDKGSIWHEEGLRTTLLSLQAGFIPSLTGRQNAIISGITLGLPKQTIEEKLEQIIEFSELKEFIDQPLAAYSSGMRMRLGFAVAIQVDPDVLLIDEVLSVGDEVFRRKSAEVIRNRIGADETTIIVTHNIQLVRKLCDRVVWLENGVNRMEGTPNIVSSVYEQSAK